jgi:polygalacturonase/alpha-beta hydrolase superfamily lysophospholipase
VDGDRAAFRNCRFLGWQDTILLNRGRQYFENCTIAGHVDFIFGAATAWFEKCRINCLGTGYVTAASTPSNQAFGFVFSNCKIAGDKPGVKTYLGRPWRIYASTIYLNCEMSDVVRSEGWFDWKKPEAHVTARYSEFHSTGAGASPTNRPDWTKLLTAAEAKQVTVEKVLGGADDWDPTLTYNLQFGPNRRDVEYGEAGGEKLLLDAHVPDGDGTFPIAIIVHGGGWMNGDKRHDISELFESLDRANFTWFSIDYRLAPENRWPACFDDVQTAIRWVKQHAVEFKGDPGRIALIGYSAGGHLATLAGTDTGADTRVQAVVGLAPPADLVVDNERRGGLTISMQSLFGFATTNIDDSVCAVLKQNSPITYIKPGLPPFLLVQGDADKTVPYPQTLDFEAKLQAAGVSCDLLTITNAQHKILDWDKFDPAWQEKVVTWLKQHLPPGGVNALSSATLPATAEAAPNAWSQVPAILARIVPPTFPGGEFVFTNYGLRPGVRGTMGTFFQSHDFAITNYGAVGDGMTDCTKAFADAIAACNKAGGGRVVVPGGKFLTGPIHLLSNVNLHVVRDATVLFTTNTEAYLPVVFTRYESTEVMNYSPLIYALGQKNIAITGEGTLDSQATLGAWHSWKSGKDSTALVQMGNNDVPVKDRVFGAGHFLRPYFIQPTRCRNVLIEGVKILGSPMWVISPLYCTNVTVRGVTVEATGPNTDGCDPDSCTDVLIQDCSFSDGDDCIAIKSGRDRDGHRVNIPSRNLVIQNSHFKAGHGGVSCGSETSGGIENVFAENCTFDSPDLDYAFRFKTNPARGGYIKNVFIRNCKVETARFGIHMTLRYGGAGALEGPYTPEMGNIDIRDCTFASLTRQPIFIEGYDGKIKITGVTIANCTFQNAADQITITNASGIHLLDNHWGVSIPQ